MATSLEPLYEDLHLHPELSFGEHRTAGTVAERLRALGLEVLKGVGRTAAITMHGRGGHGSRPETTVDPMVMAAAAVMRLQTVVAREVAGGDSADLTVGQLHAGSKHNIISNEAVMGLSVRSSTGEVRERLMSGIERIIKAESAASGADREPEIVLQESLPGLVNDAAATARTRGAFHAAFTEQAAMDPGPVTGSEDVGIISGGADVPLCYWLLGGADPATFAAATAAGTLDRDIPSNHSPHFAPLISPTLETGVAALVVAAREWLGQLFGLVSFISSALLASRPGPATARLTTFLLRRWTVPSRIGCPALTSDSTNRRPRLHLRRQRTVIPVTRQRGKE